MPFEPASTAPRQGQIDDLEILGPQASGPDEEPIDVAVQQHDQARMQSEPESEKPADEEKKLAPYHPSNGRQAEKWKPWYEETDSHSVRPSPWDLRRCLSMLHRRRWLVLGAPVVALVIAVAYLSVTTPVYEARAKLLIESQSPNVVNFKEVIEQNTAKLDYYETQLGMLRSRTLARKTLERLELWSHPEFAERRSTRLSRVANKVRSPMMSVFRPEWRPAPPPPDEPAAQSRAIDEFLARLTISYRADNRLVDAGFRSTDPSVAAAVANMIVQVYIDQNLELKLRASKEASDWLNARLVEQRSQVKASENALQRYREQNADVSLSQQQNIIVQKVAELSTATTRAKTERIETESVYKQIQAIQAAPSASDALPVILSHPSIQQMKSELASLQREQARLSETLGSRHPDLLRVDSAILRIQGQLRAEISNVAQSVRNQILAMEQKETSLARALEAQERLALALNRRGIQYSALEREVTSNRQIFEALLERAKQTEISSELRTGNAQIVDPAEVPQVPASPQSWLVLLFAVVIGVPLGTGAAFGIEFLDDRIKAPDEIQANLGIRFLGFSPDIPRRKRSANATLVNNGVPPEFEEAIRTIRANLFMCSPPQGTISLLVTSTGPGEGKTIVAANLATVLAQAGRRVLLVDADMRRSRVHQIFNERLSPGLSAVLHGAVPIADAVLRSQVPGLSVLPAGIAPKNPGDLLQLPIFAEALAAVHDQFDWIVIDSPPVMVASDALSLAHVASAVVFVIGAQMTSRANAMAAIEQLDGVRTKVIGAVLSRGAADRYSPYYGYPIARR
jgi:capsular exopolysaccharide synthesis family protein